MKRLYPVVLAIGTFCFVFQSAHATLLFSEGFNYNPGGLGGNTNSGSGVAWTGNNNIKVDGTDPLLTYSGLNNISANDLSVTWGVSSGTALNSPAWATAVSSGQIYYSFLMDMTALPSSTGSGTYLTALNPAGTSPGGSGDDIDLYINNTGAIAIRSKGTYSSPSSPVTLSLNTTYLVVMELDYAGNLASLYLNPTPGLVQPAATLTATPGSALTGVQDVGFKAQTASTTGNFLIDNVLIGTTWGDVTPTGVPEPSLFALAGLGLSGLLLRFRRR